MQNSRFDYDDKVVHNFTVEYAWKGSELRAFHDFIFLHFCLSGAKFQNLDFKKTYFKYYIFIIYI
jgi:hypothetical protein